MHVSRILCPTLIGLAACRGPVAPREREAVAPETPGSPTALQARLAAQSPAVAEPPGDAAGKLDRALDAFDAALGGRRGYIAVDKPLYQPGETIWFRLFDVASADLSAAARDEATFALIGPRGTTVLEKRVKLERGGAANDFELAGALAGGEYTVRATVVKDGVPRVTERKVIVSSYDPPRLKKQLELTRKAYGPGDHVIATVALHRATGEALAKVKATAVVALDGGELARLPVTTDGEGNAVVAFDLPAKIARGDGLVSVLVEDGGVTESVQKRIPITLADVSLALYPEGGELVAGLPGRVYFAARDALDKPADIEGRVVDGRGEVVAVLRSLHDGLGRFEVTPGTGALHVEITKPAGIAKKFPLPAARTEGCALQSVDDFTSSRRDARVAVWCTSARTVTVTGVLRERRVGTVTARVAEGAPTVVALPVPATQGALRVTVFDDKLAPLAERLVYRGRGKDLKIALAPDRAAYHPRERATIAVETRGPDGKPVAADLAVSVVDDTVLAFADDKKATLLARMYLEAELPDQKIEEPDFYFGSDPAAPAALDLVFGTYGWRRFDWKPVLDAPPAPPIDEPWTYDGEIRGKAPRAVVAKKAPAAKPVETAVAAIAPFAAPPAKPPVVFVEGNAPVIDQGATAQGITLDQDYVKNVPAAGRTFEAALGAAAGVQRDGFGITIAGATSIENVYIVDGVNTAGLTFGSVGTRLDDLAGHRIKAPKHHIATTPRFDEAAGTYAAERVFPQPTYDARYDGPRTDFRETVFWQARVVTDAKGKGTVSFSLSDAVTSFRVTAEGIGGGALGRATAQLASKKPVSLAVKLPTEVTAGDHLRLPVTIANETGEPYDAAIATKIGKAFRLTGDALPAKLRLAANERRSTFLDLDVVGGTADGQLAISVEAGRLTDAVERQVHVVASGFPREVSVAGTLDTPARHELVAGADMVPGTLWGTLTFYPSPLATMIKGSEAMIAEPGGCFEQASSTNYPNVMILGLLEEQGTPDAALVAKSQGTLERGYKLLTGYETKTRGYEWFGGDPGHEALTAYGLMEFRDMAKVFRGVDRDMVERTRAWLRARRDGRGGYETSTKAVDTFGRASKEVTDAYITYALVEAGESDLGPELAKQRASAAETKDPYLLALATRSLAVAQPKEPTTAAAAKRLVEMQGADGAWKGADHSITRSGGTSLDVETTALATLALLAAGGADGAVRKAMQWLDTQRTNGRYGSTQATILALKANAAYVKASRRTQTAGAIVVTVNGVQLPRITYAAGQRGAIEVALADHVKPGKNVIEITQADGAPLPFAATLAWSSRTPPSAPGTAVHLDTAFSTTSTRLGESVHADVTVANVTDTGVPMTVARVGLPGGVAFQTWQLQELRDKKLVDYYETRPREVILYFRGLGPKEERKIPLELLASVPGTYAAPPSQAYLYYTDEKRQWVAPATITIAP